MYSSLQALSHKKQSSHETLIPHVIIKLVSSKRYKQVGMSGRACSEFVVANSLAKWKKMSQRQLTLAKVLARK